MKSIYLRYWRNLTFKIILILLEIRKKEIGDDWPKIAYITNLKSSISTSKLIYLHIHQSMKKGSISTSKLIYLHFHQSMKKYHSLFIIKKIINFFQYLNNAIVNHFNTKQSIRYLCAFNTTMINVKIMKLHHVISMLKAVMQNMATIL